MMRSYTAGTARGYAGAMQPALTTYRGHVGRRISLRDLDAYLMRCIDDAHAKDALNLVDADGVSFLCPKCYTFNGGPVGTHRVWCWFVGRVPDDRLPVPGRWIPGGTGIDDLTFRGPGAASVLLTGGCGWHGFVKSGAVTSDA
jgi:hypothetical protein